MSGALSAPQTGSIASCGTGTVLLGYPWLVSTTRLLRGDLSGYVKAEPGERPGAGKVLPPKGRAGPPEVNQKALRMSGRSTPPGGFPPRRAKPRGIEGINGFPPPRPWRLGAHLDIPRCLPVTGLTFPAKTVLAYSKGRDTSLERGPAWTGKPATARIWAPIHPGDPVMGQGPGQSRALVHGAWPSLSEPRPAKAREPVKVREQAVTRSSPSWQASSRKRPSQSALPRHRKSTPQDVSAEDHPLHIDLFFRAPRATVARFPDDRALGPAPTACHAAGSRSTSEPRGRRVAGIIKTEPPMRNGSWPLRRATPKPKRSTNSQPVMLPLSGTVGTRTPSA